MSFKYQINIVDPNGTGASISSVLSSDLAKALDVWSGYIDGQGTVVVNLDFQQTSTGRLSGGPSTVAAIGTANGNVVVEPGSEYVMATGQQPAGASSDINITVDTGSGYVNSLDLSANLTAQSLGATGKYNPIILFMHELCHGLAMSGYYSQTGALTTGYESNFDALLQLTSTKAASFTGTNAVAVYGGDVPITSASTAGENYYHFGNTMSDYWLTPATDTDPLTRDLMNGIVFEYNYGYTVSSLDLAVLRDLGYDIPNISLAGGSGNDLLHVGTGHYTVDGGAGIDTVVIPGNAAGYSIAATAAGFTVTDKATPADSFDLANVERLQFSDTKIALDTSATGHAGETAEMIGAAFGAPALANQSFVGIGLQLFDAGQSMLQVAQLCVGALGNPDNATFVKEVWQNVVGSPIDVADLAAFTGMLTGSGGTMSQAELLVLAATAQANQTHIGLVGLATTGIQYS